MDNVKAWSQNDFAAQVSKIVYFDKIQDHHKILAYELRSDVFLEGNKKNEALFLSNKNKRSIWMTKKFITPGLTSETHRHHNILVFILPVLRRSQLGLRISI